MLKRLHFFATRSDLECLLDAFERGQSLRYVPFGYSEGKVLPSYDRGRALPRLGEATHASAIACVGYLVVSSERTVEARPVTLREGPTRYLVDQQLNPDSIVLSPGGRWNEDVLLHGRFATVSDGEEAQRMMRHASRALRKQFERIRAFWVGPEAARLLDAGVRLTISEASPREFDLAREEPVH